MLVTSGPNTDETKMEFVNPFGSDPMLRSGPLTSDPNLHPAVLSNSTLTSMAHLSSTSNGFSPSVALQHPSDNSPFPLGNVGLLSPSSTGQLAPMHMYGANHQLYGFAAMTGLHTPMLSGAPGAPPVITSVATPSMMSAMSSQWNGMDTNTSADEPGSEHGENKLKTKN